VEATGRHFLLMPISDDVTEEVSESAIEVLGEDARRLETDCEQEELADFNSGGLWFEAGGLTSLSLLEARMLAARWGAIAGDEVGLCPDIAARFAIGLRSELSDTLTQVHRQGGARERGWYLREFPAAFERAIGRLKGRLSRPEENALRAALLRLLNK